MPRKMEKIKLSDEQLKTLDGLGINFKGKELQVGLLAGHLPVISEVGTQDEEVIICVSGC